MEIIIRNKVNKEVLKEHSDSECPYYSNYLGKGFWNYLVLSKGFSKSLFCI